jgi:NAD(P)-dependent dehydrogenase (short-subunit alcohol dehydrogenase family)
MATRDDLKPRRVRGAVPEPGGEGRAVLVTGAARRVGAAVATRLAAAGYDVAIHHNRSGKEARALAKALATHGVAAEAVEADLSDAKDRKALVAAAAKVLGRPLTALVNNASTFPPRALADLTWKELAETLEVDAWAPFELSMAFARQVPRGGHGAVVNFLDARIVDEDRRHVGYHLAKRMLADFTRLCALELAPAVTVNGVGPGPTLPPPGSGESEGRALMERLRRRLPLQRTPEPADLAEAVRYLLEARAVTGQVLFVDGGRHLGRPA